MRSHQQRGFTLIEMMVAIALFAALSLVATQAVWSLMNNHQRLQTRSQHRLQFQAAIKLIEQDISQAVVRHPLDKSQLNLSDFSALKGEDDELELITLHEAIPLDPLSWPTLQRVRYRLEEGELQRWRYPAPDAPFAKAQKVTLIEGVKHFRLRFWQQGGWHDGWFSGSQLPRAIEVTLDLASPGEIRRIVLLGRGGYEKE